MSEERQPALEILFRTALEPGERLLWAGRPERTQQPTRLGTFRHGLIYVAAFVVFVVQLQLLYEWSLQLQDAPQLLMTLTSLMLLLPLLLILFGVSRAAYRKRRRVFGLTDRRLLLSQDNGRRFLSVPLEDIRHVYVIPTLSDLMALAERDPRFDSIDDVFRDASRTEALLQPFWEELKQYPQASVIGSLAFEGDNLPRVADVMPVWGNPPAYVWDDVAMPLEVLAKIRQHLPEPADFLQEADAAWRLS
jgi:hypothetical protein